MNKMNFDALKDSGLSIEKYMDNSVCIYCKEPKYGEDFVIYYGVNDREEILKSIDGKITNFDVGAECMVWLSSDGHGMNGAPDYIGDVVEAQELKLDIFKDAYSKLKKL